MKALLYIAIGATAMYFYMNPSEIDKFKDCVDTSMQTIGVINENSERT